MSESTTSKPTKRPEFSNIDFGSLRTYRWPLASLASGMHRVSGAIMFFLMPFVIWMFDSSITSEISFEKFTSAFGSGPHTGLLGIPGVLWKLVALGLIWAYLHHFFAGLRHLWMDTHHEASTKEFGKSSAATVIVLAIGLTLVLGAKLFGLY